MKNCSNCFNGCTEIVSDQCVKYTGIDIPDLQISNGDTLASVEEKLIAYLNSVISGLGITPDIDSSILCDILQRNLPSIPPSGSLTLNEMLEGLIKSACELDASVVDINLTLNALESNYDVGCLTDVFPNEGTHNVLQSVIKKLCQMNIDLTNLALDVSTNYVKIVDINTYIQNYLDTVGSGALVRTKMIPYAAMEYYGPLTYFDLQGRGIGDWEQVYLCNGQNGTPDKRGRVAVGVVTGMGGGFLSPNVDPASPNSGNPDYLFGTTLGQNTVSLTENQIPSHTHTATAVATSVPHSHFVCKVETVNSRNPPTPLSYIPHRGQASTGDDDYSLTTTLQQPDAGLTSTSDVDVTVNVQNAPSGGGLPHSNIQPVLACYYIMYIPA